MGELGCEPAERVVECHRPFEPDPGNTGGGKKLIIMAHSYKGGTGKTLFSVNLAISLAKRGKKVCLLDLDFHAPSLSAIFAGAKSEHWLNDYMNQVCEINEVLLDYNSKYVTKGNMFVGLANPSIDAIRNLVTNDKNWKMRALFRLLSLKEYLIKELNFDYVVFDTSPGLQYNSINALVSADVVFVVTTLEKSDVEGTRQMINDLYELFEKKTEIVVNKIPNGFLYSKNQKDLKIFQLPIIGTISCSCDLLNIERKFFFASEKPNHPFTKTLEEIATKIEHNELQSKHLITATQL